MIMVGPRLRCNRGLGASSAGAQRAEDPLETADTVLPMIGKTDAGCAWRHHYDVKITSSR